MMSPFTAFGFVNLCLAFAALELFAFLNSQCGAGTTTACAEAPLLDSAAEVLPLSAAVGVLFLFVAVVFTYRHLVDGHVVVGAVPVAGAGNGRRSILGLVMFALCVSVGTLESIVFEPAAGGGGGAGHGAQARALGLAALRALPATATGTFFGGMMLIVVAYVCGGGEGGDTGAVAGDGPIQRLLRLLTKVAAGMAAALVGQIAMVVLTLYAATAIAKC